MKLLAILADEGLIGKYGEIQVAKEFGEVHFRIVLREGFQPWEEAPHIFIKDSHADYWNIVWSEGNKKFPGLGTELYLAAISFASSGGHGLFSEDEMASSSALRLRPRLVGRGVRLIPGSVSLDGFEPGGTGPRTGVLMSGKVRPKFPVRWV